MTQALYCRIKRTTELHNQFLCVEMRRDKSLGGIHKQVSVMLNIKFHIKRWRGLACNIWHMTEVTAFTVKSYCATCLTCYGYIKRFTSCHCDSIGLVLLILLGCELRVLCVQGILILSSLIFTPSLYSTF